MMRRYLGFARPGAAPARIGQRNLRSDGIRVQ
jgi:hypothetical protein